MLFAVPLALMCVPAHATDIPDATNDFLPTYLGPHDADLDVTSFGVLYDPIAAVFRPDATFAGVIDATKAGFYVIGANTGTGPNNFAAIGAGGVRFNQAIVIQKDGTAAISGVALAGNPVTIAGNSLTVLVPLSRLPTTGFQADNYGFNIWPRTAVAGITGNAAISDFAPNNATIAPAPEPATWAMMMLGFGLMGGVLRYRKSQGASARVALSG